MVAVRNGSVCRAASAAETLISSEFGVYLVNSCCRPRDAFGSLPSTLRSVRQHTEREVKLVPSEGFLLSELGDLLPPRVFYSTYHDTPDLRLARHGITLRRRTEGGSRLWQLKIPTVAARIELEVPGGQDQPPTEFTDLLAVHLQDAELGNVARLRTHREIVLRDGAEIAEDAVSVFEGRQVVKHFRELEVELVDGDESSLRRLERRLRKAGAETAELTPKLLRALEVSFVASPTPVEAASPAEALGQALAAQHRQVVDHDPGTRLGTDPEDLHQMRVATRRARAFLRAAKSLVDRDWANNLRAELGWLGSRLGPARDGDVLLAYVTQAVAALDCDASGLLEALRNERTRARRAAVTALSRKRYFALLDRLAEAAEPPVVDSDVRLRDLWWKEFKRTRKAFETLDRRSQDEELHAARIRVKRARYAAELAAPELGEAGERFVSAAKKLQDVLGEHQDSAVAEEWVVRWSNLNAGSSDLAEALVAQQRKRRQKARKAWPDAWAELARRGRQARR